MPLVLTGCGKKGPPLAPLNLLPEPAANVTARRLGSTVYLQMSVPSKNANGPGPAAVDHLEIYAVTAAAGAPTPANRELLTSTRVIGRIPVKPPVTDDESAPADDAPKDTRPAPGEPVTFTETLTEAQLKPQILPAPKTATAATTPSRAAGTATETTPPASVPTPSPPEETPAATELPGTPEVPAAGATSIGAGATVPRSQTAPVPAPPAASAAATASAPPPPVTVPTRIYMVRGITKRGRPGSPSARLLVPLIPAPPPVTALATSFTETALTLTWLPPVLESGSAPAKMTYNVYLASSTTPDSSESNETKPVNAPTPLNEKPLDATSFEHAGAQPGVQQCFVVRTVEAVAAAVIESEPSMRTCVIPRDTFPPAAPKALSAVAGPGAINLIWDANTEADVVGYVVLRGEAPGDTLQPLNNEPARETRYRDATVTPGVRYVYAIIAVDHAGNRSGQSVRVEETAR